MINVDKNQVSQVFINIFLNSIQALENGRFLKITVESLDGQLIITISDTGKGIPEEILPKVFDPFLLPKKLKKEQGWDSGLLKELLSYMGGRSRSQAKKEREQQ